MKVVRLEDCINEIKSLDNCGVITRSTNHICEDMRKEVKEFEAVPIPDNATNGDVVKLIFPEYEETRTCGDVRYGSKEYVNLEFVVGEEWWDAAYQQGYSDDIRELMKKSKTDALDKVRENIVEQEPKIKVLDRDEVARKLGTVDIYMASAWITLLDDLEYLKLKICEVEE